MSKNGKLKSVEPITRMGQGRYSSVLEMVRDLSDPKFAQKFEKQLKKLTVWVYIDLEKNFVQVFKRFKSAKRFIGGIHPDADLSKIEKDGMDGKVWESNNERLLKTKIIKA